MNKKEWQDINRAGKLLDLADRATMDEIKRAYRRLCKKYHPDTTTAASQANTEMIYRLTEAYELLMRHCLEYSFPLKPGDSDIVDAEDWWMDRFGQDPLWGRRR